MMYLDQTRTSKNILWIISINIPTQNWSTKYNNQPFISNFFITSGIYEIRKSECKIRMSNTNAKYLHLLNYCTTKNMETQKFKTQLTGFFAAVNHNNYHNTAL